MHLRRHALISLFFQIVLSKPSFVRCLADSAKKA